MQSKKKWKKWYLNKIKDFVFKKLGNEKSKLENTKHIVFNDLKIRKYLEENQNTAISAKIENYEAGHLQSIADSIAPGDCKTV